MGEPTTEQAVAVVEAAGTGLVAQGGFDIRTLDQAWRLAQAFIAGRMVPKGMNEPGGVVACWQAGAEMGVGPARSLAKISIINGVPCIEVELALALTRKRGAFVQRPGVQWSIDGEVVDEAKLDGLGKLDSWPDSLTCQAYAVPKGEKIAVYRRFSVADARRARLWDNKDVWKSYPKRMLRARAMAFLLRDEFSEYFEGSITEEMRDVTARDVTPHGGTEDTPKPAAAEPDALFDEAVTDAQVVEPEEELERPGDAAQLSDPVTLTEPQPEGRMTATEILGRQDADTSGRPLLPERVDDEPERNADDGSMTPLPDSNKKYRTMKYLVQLFKDAEHPMTFKTVAAWSKEQRIAAWDWIWDRKAFDHWMEVNPKSVRANTPPLPRPSFIPEYGETEAAEPPHPASDFSKPTDAPHEEEKQRELSADEFCLRPIGVTGTVCGMDPGHPGNCTPL